MAPRLARGADGEVLLSWLEPVETGHQLRFARLNGEAWSTPTTLVEGADFFANWADTPSVVALGEGWVAAWPEMLGDATYAYGLSLAWAEHTAAGEVRVERSGLLHDDATPEEHGFVSFLPAEDGLLRAFWLDGRALSSEGGSGRGAMQLRTATVRAAADGVGGVGGVEPSASTLLDARVCECCSTDAALTADGPIVAYRGRSSDEIRDIYVLRGRREPSADRWTWSDPTLVHADGWKIAGCPVNGPAIAAAGERVAIAWFTAAAGPRVAMAWSDDGGATFGAPVEIDGGGNALGRVDLALDPVGRAWVTWLTVTQSGPAIQLRSISPEGDLGPTRSVAATTERRASGVPRSLADHDRLLIAWVDDTEPSALRVAAVPWP